MRIFSGTYEKKNSQTARSVQASNEPQQAMNPRGIVAAGSRSDISHSGATNGPPKAKANSPSMSRSDCGAATAWAGGNAP